MENVQVVFIYNSLKEIIQCKFNDIMEDICNKFASKIKKNIKNFIFLHNGNVINKNNTFGEQANNEEKKDCIMTILVNENVEDSNKKKIKISKEVICHCKEDAIMRIEDYKISLFGCKNCHEKNNIFLSQYEELQIIDESKIICDKCKDNNKGITHNNTFYICFTCHMNLCPLCLLNHDKKHDIIDYEQKNYLCEIHNENFNSYCKKCKKNLCIQCENSHFNHDIIQYSKILPNKGDKLDEIKQLKNQINKMKNKINEIKDFLDSFIKNINIYFKINEELINNYNVKNRNYQILTTINNINNKKVIEDINIVINDNIKVAFDKIFEIYNKMYATNNIKNEKNKNNKTNKFIEKKNKIKNNFNNKKENFNNLDNKKNKNNNNILNKTMENFINNKQIENKFIQSNKNITLKKQILIKKSVKDFRENSNEINIEYKIDKNEKNIIIFGHDFVENNKNNCKIIFNNKVQELVEYINITNYKVKEGILKIKLKGINNIKNMSSMFCGCLSLSSISNISFIDTSKVIDMSYMFAWCDSLEFLPNISKWNTSNVTNMSYMFNGCKSLKSLKDILKWDFSKVRDVTYMLEGCRINFDDFSKLKLNENTKGKTKIFS